MWQIFCSKCTKYWEKLLLVFWQTRSATVTADVTEYVWHFWWCTEISPPDSRIPALPHYVDNAFTWREPHKHFEFLSVLVSITSGTVWKWKKKILEGKICGPTQMAAFQWSEACPAHASFSLSWYWRAPCDQLTQVPFTPLQSHIGHYCHKMHQGRVILCEYCIFSCPDHEEWGQRIRPDWLLDARVGATAQSGILHWEEPH